ncbi:MAG: CPBP family intramembrane metalloprotease [Gammaproteobacteria bacterium]|nr:CPBP family intramembrane metalloprotease [Gammaproteobacteria bacterium]
MTRPNTPWGVWPSIGLAGLLLGAVVGVDLVVSLIYTLRHTPGLGDAIRSGHWNQHFTRTIARLAANGDLLSLVLNLRALVGLGLIWLFCRARNGLPLRQYLALNLPAWRDVLVLVITLGGFIALSEWIYFLFGRDPVGDFMLQAYHSAKYLPLLWFAVVISAPLFEEILFRGFLYAGLSRSWLGHSGTILVTAAGFALVHLQYAWPEMLVIFCFGVLLGVARWRSGSVLLPILLHALNNFTATVQLSYACQ